MKVIALRQAMVNVPDNAEVLFMNDEGEEFTLAAALHMPEYDALYFGETQDGLISAIEELEDMDPEEIADRLRDAEDEDYGLGDDDDPLDSCAVEGGDVAPRCDITLAPEKKRPGEQPQREWEGEL